MSEKYLNYGISREQSVFLEDLEKLIGKPIPLVNEINSSPSGFKVGGDNIVELGLHNRKLSSLPESIGNLTFLKFLYLRNYAPITFSESILKLTSLKILHLMRNSFTIFPELITRLSFLEELNLWSNELTILPDSIENLKSLKILDISFNQLEALPDSLGNLTSLEKLNLEKNKLTTLPESITNLKSLKTLYLGINQLSSCLRLIFNLESLQSLTLDHNEIKLIPESIGNLVCLEELHLNHNKIPTLPNSIMNLKSLKKLIIWSNLLNEFPESITHLNSLKVLDICENKLKFLPESVSNLTSLENLNLSNNKLTFLPKSFWLLKNLKTIDLSGNEWKGEWKGIEQYSAQEILEFCRKRAPIAIYISYSQDEQKLYKVLDFKENLKNREEIYDVYINDDNKIPESQLFLFIGTNKSITSKICQYELGIALNHDIEIIPIKGMDLKEWEKFAHIDLRKEGYDYIDLSNKKGFEFNSQNSKEFYNELYEYMKQYKREVNLFEPEERKLDKQKENFINIFEKLIESEEFGKNLKEKISLLKELFEKLRKGEISPIDYISTCSEILYSKLK